MHLAGRHVPFTVAGTVDEQSLVKVFGIVTHAFAGCEGKRRRSCSRSWREGVGLAKRGMRGLYGGERLDNCCDLCR